MIRRFFVLLTFTAALVVTVAEAQNETCVSPADAQRAIVSATRAINTAELQYFRENGRYAQASELATYPGLATVWKSHFAKRQSKGAIAPGGPEDLLPGYDVQLLVSADGKAYSFLATKKADPCRAVGLVSDNKGLIYFVSPM